MKPLHNRPAIGSGVVVGAMLAAPLVAVFYLAWRLAGLPFVPFDVFDWMTRTLPGPVVTFGIDTIVSVIRGAHLGATAETAKAVEKTMAVTGVLATGGLAGAVLFGLLRASRGRHPYLLGVCVGATVGAPAAFISRTVNQSATASHIASALWILAAFLTWSAALSWSYRRLSAADVSEAARLDRRRFLIRLGGATAVITVAGAVVGNSLVGRRKRGAVEGGAGRIWHEAAEVDRVHRGHGSLGARVLGRARVGPVRADEDDVRDRHRRP